jgi:hypothetical protein
MLAIGQNCPVLRTTALKELDFLTEYIVPQILLLFHLNNLFSLKFTISVFFDFFFL